MEIIRENINVIAQSFLEGLGVIENIETFDFNYIGKTLTIQTGENWVSENLTQLDDLIVSETIAPTFIEVISTNVVINSITEFQKKVKKQSSIKSKIQSYDYDKTEKILICKCDNDWSEANTTTLDSVIDDLVGYDVVTQLMDGYVQKEKDGIAYYNLKRGEEVEKIMNSVISSIDAFVIANKLEKTQYRILTGDWVTAFREIVPTEINEIYTQEVKDEYLNYIKNYVDTNYTNGSYMTQGILDGTF